MCQSAFLSAGLIRMTVGDLKKLNREHPENWTNAKFLKVYGTDRPDFRQEPLVGLPE